MSLHTRETLENMLEDVVNELHLSECMIDTHGQLGTPPAELVRLVLDEKDRTIRNLKAGYPDRIEEKWRADAGWQRADAAEAKLAMIRENLT
tara:strand:- start:1324 stop:1599 length:276 start_codon:yes stop_codon:yes gene_type:complete